jgi:Large eukaryotic DNA virus major capsid protein/Major capsid protein N-terminus
MYLRVELGQVTMNNFPQDELLRNQYQFAWVREVGNFIVDNIQYEIGGSQIDKHYGHWMSTWHDLTKDVNTEPAYKALVGDVPELTALRSPDSQGNFTQDYVLYIPLIFWSCTNSGLALPLIALQYHEVKLWIEFADFSDLIVYTNNLTMNRIGNGIGILNDASLLVDYVYIDTEERRRFAQVGHEYLINQLQFTGVEAVNNNPLRVKLGFNHPTKEFIFCIKSGDYVSKNSPFLCYSNTDDWSNALTYAATNVISGSVTVGDVASGPSTSQSPEVNISSASYDQWNTINPVSTNTRNASKFSVFTYQAGQGVDDTNSPSYYAKLLFSQMNPSGDDTNVNFKFRRDVFVNPQSPSYNLGDYIQKFAIIIYYTVVNADGSGKVGTLSYQVKPWEHSIMVRDVSVPVANWTDNRYSSKNASNSYADMDIWAVLPTVSGLLINNMYNPVENGLIQLNGHDRFDQREGAYFHLMQTYDYHSSTPGAGVNVYSFALHPEQHQPSGTCNLSRIDNTTVVLKLYTDVPFPDPSRNPPALSIVGPSSEFYIYDTNYNVLRVMSGMGGTAYSN